MKSCANINVITSLSLNSGFLPGFPFSNLTPSDLIPIRLQNKYDR